MYESFPDTKFERVDWLGTHTCACGSNPGPVYFLFEGLFVEKFILGGFRQKNPGHTPCPLYPRVPRWRHGRIKTRFEPYMHVHVKLRNQFNVFCKFRHQSAHSRQVQASVMYLPPKFI